MESHQARNTPPQGENPEFSREQQQSYERPRVSPQILLIQGAELSGKSEQAKILAKRTGLPFVSSGDAFREIQDRCKKKIENGEEVSELEKKAYDILMNPDHAYAGAQLFEDIMRWRFTQKEPLEKFKNGFILEGAPRSKEQYEEFERIFHDLGFDMPMKAVYLTVSGIERSNRQSMRGPRPDDVKLAARLSDHYKDIRFKRRLGREKWNLKTVHTTHKSMHDINEEIVDKLDLDRPLLLRYREATLTNDTRKHVDWLGENGYEDIAYDVMNAPIAEREGVIRAYMDGKIDSIEGLNGDEGWGKIFEIEKLLEFELSKLPY